MEPTSRPRRVDVVVLGRGLLAATTAVILAERGKRVALLAERESDPDPSTDDNLRALHERLAAVEKSYCVVGTWVRGISVIENAVLGVIAEEARYDGRTVLNLAQDERHAAYARMMRQPRPAYGGPARIAPATVKGGWQLEGQAGPDEIDVLAEQAADVAAPLPP